MRRVFEEFLLLAADVAGHAACRVFFCVGAKMKNGKLFQRIRNLGIDAEREDGMLLHRPRRLALIALRRLNRIRVSFSRAVTGFAAGDVTLVGNGYLAMNSFLILAELWLVAGPAAVRPGVIGRAALQEFGGHRSALRRFGQLLPQSLPAQKAEPEDQQQPAEQRYKTGRVRLHPFSR